MTVAEQRAAAQPSIAAARSFQRVASGPALSSGHNSTAITPASLRAGAPMSNGLRGTARKLRPGPQRVTIEQYREMDEKNRLEDEEIRARAELGTGKEWERGEEKENITETESAGDPNSNLNLHSKPQQRPSGVSPRLSSRSASTSQIDRITSGLPSRASSSRAPLQVPGRQILPGPSRAGRILMGAKYTATSGGGTGGFDRISEVDTLDSNLVGSSDLYGGEDTEAGMSPLIHWLISIINHQ